jgi:hydrogenase maturation protein HypF
MSQSSRSIPVSAVVVGEEIRVRGLVQGVGFRPTVWRIARELSLAGAVRNDGDGVLVQLWGEIGRIDAFCERLITDCPPLARIDGVDRRGLMAQRPPSDFVIVESAATAVHTGIVPDAAVCDACAAEIQDPANRRFRYPFTNCTHCGPRLSIVRGIPYDRAKTSMSVFALCDGCAAEYADPADRRFHAQPNACALCGPKTWLVDPDRRELAPGELGAADAVAAASRLLADGRIVAIKGIGGFHLACDATDAAAVAELRRRKRRWAKPFALMARDLDVIRRYCSVSAEEGSLLLSPAAPVVLLDFSGPERVAAEIAPRQCTLGFMLAYSPLHRLLLQDWSVPLVMTSGNSSDEPQCIDNDDATRRLHGLADAFLLHDRAIVNRVDDSVARVMDGSARLLRRARGYAPAPLPLPTCFRSMPSVLALGGELKNTICILRDGQAVLSQHLGDLHEAQTAQEFMRTIALYRELFQHQPEAIAVDLHPGYRASGVGRELAAAEGSPLIEVQHHRAHIAAVLADNQWPIDGGPVVGVALDGSGYGDDGSIWGGEWLVGDYRHLTRAAHLRPVTLPGGTRAILEPWRNLFAQIVATMGWDVFERRFGAIDAAVALRRRPVELLSRMIEGQINSPRTSSCGRLFDAVAAALAICADGIVYEGQAAIELEAICADAHGEPGYDFALYDEGGIWVLDPAPMWEELFSDLADALPAARISARFHAGLAEAVVELSARIAAVHRINAVALSGGVFQNRTLFERVCHGLRARGLEVLSHRRVPSNDGGLALGQAVAAAALLGRLGP